MSCYFRHMKDVFEEIGLKITPDNRNEVDRVIHRIAGMEYKDCPTTWKTLKAEFLGDGRKRARFVKKLRKSLTPAPRGGA